MKLELGTILHLQGISLHGKNRIKQYGPFWKIKMVRNQTNFPGNGPFFLLETEQDLRWIAAKNDPHFKIIGNEN